jgi:hypothetical protein
MGIIKKRGDFMQEFKPIPGFDNYLASNDGTIWTQKSKGGNDRSSDRLLKAPRILKTHANRSGYLCVNLDRKGITHARLVHRLILETFIGPAPHGYHGCHYPDKTRTNNKLDNLRWDSVAENAKDKYRDKNPNSPKMCRRCHEIKPRSEFYRDNRSPLGIKSECKKCHIYLSIKTRDPIKKRNANREYMRRKRSSNSQYGRAVKH